MSSSSSSRLLLVFLIMAAAVVLLLVVPAPPIIMVAAFTFTFTTTRPQRQQYGNKRRPPTVASPLEKYNNQHYRVSSFSKSSSSSSSSTSTSLSVVYFTADSSNNSNKTSSSSPSQQQTTITTIEEVPIFDFTTTTTTETTTKSDSDVLKFDRIDDAIMGGISTSQIRQIVNVKDANAKDDDERSYASWSGMCRTDGGGFCGTRTLPFKDGKPLMVKVNDNNNSQGGFYIKLRLNSDNEPERRVWKMTTRTQNIQTSEQVYQSSFDIPKRRRSIDIDIEKEEENEKESLSSNAMMNLNNLITPPKKQKSADNKEKEKEKDDLYWNTIYVPFNSFVQVRGPRIVENGPPLDVSDGIYQIGLSLSKFQINKNVTQLENFRDGYFDLHIKEIGIYYMSELSEDGTDDETKTTPQEIIVNNSTPTLTQLTTLTTLTKEEAKNKRPLILKVLSPIAKLFFVNEKRNRRKSATKILRDKRGYTRTGIIKFGFQRNVKSNGIIIALGQFLLGIVSELTRIVLFWSFRIGLIFPIMTIRRILKQILPSSSSSSMSKKNNNNKETMSKFVEE